MQSFNFDIINSKTRFLLVFSYDLEPLTRRPTVSKTNTIISPRYKMASDLADQYLEPTNMTRLNNALAYSVFLAEVMADYDKAVAVAKPAFESAVRKMDHLDGITYEKSALVMHRSGELVLNVVQATYRPSHDRVLSSI